MKKIIGLALALTCLTGCASDANVSDFTLDHMEGTRATQSWQLHIYNGFALDSINTERLPSGAYVITLVIDVPPVK